MTAAIVAQQALTQQAIGLSIVKQNAESQQAIANLVDQAARSVPVSSSSGSNVNISV